MIVNLTYHELGHLCRYYGMVKPVPKGFAWLRGSGDAFPNRMGEGQTIP